MDLCNSTTSGLRLSTKRLDRFNLALVNQLSPHLEAMELDSPVVKFTGDGWLVMSDEQEDVAKLCCLAMVMAANFQREISRETAIPLDNIPAMRLAICWGRDLEVSLPQGLRDFVGNSVRRAVRANQFCLENEILIDETVRTWVAHDFLTQRVELADRIEANPWAKVEEELTLHSLGSLKAESAADPDAPVYFVRTLSQLGRAAEADILANRISDQLRASAPTTDDPSELLSRWNELLTSEVDYDTARALLADMRASGLKPDVRTYNALIEKASDFRSESRWLQAMTQDGIKPDVSTYNILIRVAESDDQLERRVAKMELEGIPPDADTLRTLVNRSPEFEAADRWVDRLAAVGVSPDQATAEKMVNLAPDFVRARQWLERMMALGYEPSEPCFIAVFSKDVTQISADDLLRWYLSLPHHPTHPIKRAIAEYRRKGMVEDALRLSLDYPHTDTALKTIRQFPEAAIRYFQSVVEHNPRHPNGEYALGLSLVELGRLEEALPHLRQAYDLASAGTRKDELARYLQLLMSLPPSARGDSK